MESNFYKEKTLVLGRALCATRLRDEFLTPYLNAAARYS